MSHIHTEPFVRITKRQDITSWRAWLIRIISVVLALAVCAVVIYAMVKLNPIKVYAAMWKGAFGTSRRIFVTARDAVMLLCIGIGLAPAFKMRFWNIGAEGQVLAGGDCDSGLHDLFRRCPADMAAVHINGGRELNSGCAMERYTGDF